MTQSARLEALQKFKDGEVPLMIASDVAARGLDIAGLSHVFNFDVPGNAEDYVHRIGRTGRAGKSGRAFTIAASDDDQQICGRHRKADRQIDSAGRWCRSRGKGRPGEIKRPAAKARAEKSTNRQVQGR